MYGDMTIKDWLKYFFLMMIPFFNFIYMIMLLCGYNEQKHPSLNAMVRASFIFGLIIGAITFVLLIVFGGIGLVAGLSSLS